jgi:hypothetical protein
LKRRTPVKTAEQRKNATKEQHMLKRKWKEFIPLLHNNLLYQAIEALED